MIRPIWLTLLLTIKGLVVVEFSILKTPKNLVTIAKNKNFKLADKEETEITIKGTILIIQPPKTINKRGKILKDRIIQKWNGNKANETTIPKINMDWK